MLGRSIDFFERTQTGDLLDRFSGVGPISVWLMAVVEGALASMLQIVFALLILAFKLPLVALLLGLLLPFNIWESKRAIHATKPYRQGWQKHAGRMSGILGELVANISTIRSLDAEEPVLQRYLDEQKSWRDYRDGLNVVQRVSGACRIIVNAAAVTSSICLVTYGAVSGNYTPGDVALVVALSQTVLFGIGPITQILNQSGEVAVSAARLRDLIERETVPATEGQKVLGNFESLEFHGVSFRYPGAPSNALTNVCFTLKRGEKLGIVGPSGAGKSTIIKLLLGFYAPTEGIMLINGENFENYTPTSVRAAFGVVLQDVSLLNTSISDNIRIGRMTATDEAVYSAGHLASADAFISRLESGYDTIVGERGVKLSGGQKQRIAIARALLREPEVFIFDEATSALDGPTENMLQHNLNTAFRDRTTIVVAHRLSTIKTVSSIIVIEGGEITAHGAQEDLLTVPETFFSKAVASQGAANSHQYSSEDETSMHWKLRNG